MRIKYSIFLMSFFMISVSELIAQNEVENFLRDFSYETRKEMKFSSEKITKLLENEEVILLDIRFREEQLAWSMDYALKIPLDELPDRLDELQRDKLIVTACPHKDRTIIAMMFLKSKGYKTGYLKDGLLGLADYLRGDNAKEFIEKLNAK